MVSVVPAAGKADRTPPRVMPKVFADVPTQKELEKARSARKSMGVWVVILLAVLIGTGGLIAWELLIYNPAVAAEIKTKADDAQKADGLRIAAENALKAKQGEYNKLYELYNPLKDLSEKEKEVVNLKLQIDARVKDYPPAKNMTINTSGAGWAAYNRREAWKGANAAEVTADLKARAALLNDLLGAVNAVMPPPKPGEKPKCYDPAGCDKKPASPAAPSPT